MGARVDRVRPRIGRVALAEGEHPQYQRPLHLPESKHETVGGPPRPPPGLSGHRASRNPPVSYLAGRPLRTAATARSSGGPQSPGGPSRPGRVRASVPAGGPPPRSRPRRLSRRGHQSDFVALPRPCTFPDRLVDPPKGHEGPRQCGPLALAVSRQVPKQPVEILSGGWLGAALPVQLRHRRDRGLKRQVTSPVRHNLVAAAVNIHQLTHMQALHRSCHAAIVPRYKTDRRRLSPMPPTFQKLSRFPESAYTSPYSAIKQTEVPPVGGKFSPFLSGPHAAQEGWKDMWPRRPKPPRFPGPPLIWRREARRLRTLQSQPCS